jgi:hypothetical protein
VAFVEDPIAQGYAAGVLRAQEYGLLGVVDADTEDLVRASLSIAAPLLSEQDASPRFVALFGELVTVAALARVVNNEPPLSDVDIAEYFHSTLRFTNSWLGWRCRDEDR